MAYLIGTDEAGYGPNLGPLVVTATMWRLSDERHGDDLYDLLADAVACDPNATAADGRLAVADSKALYHAGSSLAALERGVLAVVREAQELAGPLVQRFLLSEVSDGGKTQDRRGRASPLGPE